MRASQAAERLIRRSKKCQGTTSQVAEKLTLSKTLDRFVTRARLQPGRKRRKIKRWALALGERLLPRQTSSEVR
jgi:hypothetical protein